MQTLRTEQEVLRFLLKQVGRSGPPVMATHAGYHAGVTLAATVAERGYIDSKQFNWERILGEAYFNVFP